MARHSLQDKKNNPKIRMEPKKHLKSKKKQTVGIALPDFKIQYKSIVTKIAWYWYKNRQTDQ